MTAPSKVSGSPRAGISAARTRKLRKFAVSDGAPFEVVEDGPSLAGRLTALAALLTLAVKGRAPMPRAAVAARFRHPRTAR